VPVPVFRYGWLKVLSCFGHYGIVILKRWFCPVVVSGACPGLPAMLLCITVCCAAMSAIRRDVIVLDLVFIAACARYPRLMTQ
jgi:hypothetical protein